MEFAETLNQDIPANPIVKFAPDCS
jgi:hypothetical protein